MLDRAEIGVDQLPEIGEQADLLGDVGGEFHHLVGAAGGVEDRVVGGLDPDLAPVLAEAPELRGLIGAVPQRRPEHPVGFAVAIGGLDEQAVVPADHLVPPVAHRGQEVVIGLDHHPVEVERDHRLDLVDRRDLAGAVGLLGALPGDVGGELHHLVGPPPSVEHRIVGRLDPDRPAAAADPPELARLEAAGAQAIPERPVFRGIPVIRIDEQAVVLADHLRQGVADRVEEIGIRREDAAVEIELDHPLHAVEGGQLRGRFTSLQGSEHGGPTSAVGRLGLGGGARRAASRT